MQFPIFRPNFLTTVGDMHGFTVDAEKGTFGLDPANYNGGRGTHSDGQTINLPAT